LKLQPKSNRDIVLEQATIHVSGEDGHAAYDSATEQENVPSEASGNMDENSALVNSSDSIMGTHKSNDETVSNSENASSDEIKKMPDGETATVPLPTSWKQDRHPKRNRFGGTRKIVVPGSEDEFLLSDCQ
jgi:molecular chaperone DnaK (HSP70)